MHSAYHKDFFFLIELKELEGMLPKISAALPLNRNLADTVFLFGIIVLKK